MPNTLGPNNSGGWGSENQRFNRPGGDLHIELVSPTQGRRYRGGHGPTTFSTLTFGPPTLVKLGPYFCVKNIHQHTNYKIYQKLLKQTLSFPASNCFSRTYSPISFFCCTSLLFTRITNKAICIKILMRHPTGKLGPYFQKYVMKCVF